MGPKRVLIVGGGLSGWMAAAYLNAALRNNGQRPVEISLIEPPAPGRNDHDEATIPNIKQILAVVGINEIELLKHVDGTFKQATRYSNWLRGTGDFFYHPFDDVRAQPVDRAARRWLMSDRSVAFVETVSPQPVICDLGLAPQPLNAQPGGNNLKYAYHLNAGKFAELLCEIATSRGVRRLVDTVTDIEMANDGNIVALKTENGARLEADLFIDCGGLTALLAEKQMGVDWVDCSQWLPCDRETTLRVDYELHYSGKVRPYTSATAASAGWIREIPLQNRRTISYIHASRYIDAADATRELRAFEGGHAASLDTHTRDFKVGHRAQAWAGNCVSIGDSAGFLEPLESTGLYLSELGTSLLADHFPFGDDMAAHAFRYNRIMSNRFYEILDVVNLHYCLSKREDSEFWREVGKPERVHDRVRAKLEFWTLKIPSKADFVDQRFPGQREPSLTTGPVTGDRRSPIDTAAVFGLHSYEAILYGMQFLADECDQWFGTKRPGTQVPRYIIEDLQRSPHILPPHDAWLRSIAGMRNYPVSPGVLR